MSRDKSEFGKGFVYCLGLFLAHADRVQDHIKSYAKMAESNPDLFTKDDAAEMWFNGAADHFFDFQPEFAPTEELKKRAEVLRDKCLEWRLSYGNHTKATIKDAIWAIQETKDLLRAIDAANNVPTEKGQWE